MTTALLDDLLPDHDARMRHHVVVSAPAEKVWEAFETARVEELSPWVGWLLLLRGLRGPRDGTLRGGMYRGGFRFLVDRPGKELVAGVMGRFWALRERAALIAPIDEQHFRSFDEPGSARALMSLRVEQLEDGRTLLETETRVRAIDEAGRRRFAAYWRVIRPFSGLIRREMLRAFARKAEAA